MSAALSVESWNDQARSLSYRNQAFIGGKFAASLTGKTFDCINPATGQVLTKVAACEQADVDAAVKAARAAFDKGTWANMPPAQRKRVMLKLAELMMKNRDELALLETLDMGKPIAYSTTRRHPGLGQHGAVVRRGDRQDLRRGGADAGQCRGHDHPRAARAWSPPSCRGTSRC